MKGSCYGIYSTDNKLKGQMYYLLLYRHECFTGKYTTRKIHKNYIWDPSGLFFIISHVSLSIFSVISSVSLVLKFIGVSSKHLRVFLESLRQSSDIFGNSRKCSGMFVWPSEQFLKIFGNLRKVVGNLRKIVKNAAISMSI